MRPAVRLAALLLTTCSAARPQESTNAPADGRTKLEQATRRYEQAFYELALGSFEAAAAEFPVPAACGAARCLVALGRPADALARLDAVAPPGPADASWTAARVDALVAVGRYDEALAALDGALAAAGARPPGADIELRRRAGDLLAYLGRFDAARRALAPLRALEPAAYPEHPAQRADLARGLLLLAELDPPPDLSDHVRDILHRVIQPPLAGTHRARWMARLAAADLLADKHNQNEARSDYQAVVRMNPRVADAYAGLARLAFERNDASETRRQAREALQRNPRHARALRLLARLHLAESDPAGALAALEPLLAVNPCDLEALALSALAAEAAGDPGRADAFRARADAVNPRSGLVQATLGEGLSARRHFDRAEEHFHLATQYEPHRPRYHVALADLWLMRGEEEAARAALKRARAADPYDERVVTLLNMLYELETMERVETEHFVLRYDADHDPLVGLVAPTIAEQCYARVTARFSDYVPQRKTLVELFPRSDLFAARVSGRPWISTVGASTGPVIAMLTPRRGRDLAFGWTDVFTHELVHTVTLGLSNGRVPRWLTEGLAELCEPAGRSWDATLLMVERLRAGALFGVTDIDGAFASGRPRDVAQGYAQGRLMAEFILAEWGDDALRRLLAACAQERDHRAPFQRTLQITCAGFDERFEAWLLGQAESWGFPPRRYPSRHELESRLDRDARDADALGALAYLEHLDDRPSAAREMAERALAIQPQQPEALLCLGLLGVESPEALPPDELFAAQDDLYDRVRPLLRSRADEPLTLWTVADLARRTRPPDVAADLLLRLVRRAPDCTPAYQALAELCMQIGDEESAYPFLVEWARRCGHETGAALRLAEMLERAGRPAEALRWARRIVEIDPFLLANHERLGRLLVASGRWEEAVAPLRLVCDRKPNDERAWSALAEAYARLDRRAEALDAARRAVALGADSRAQRIIQELGTEPP